MNKEIVWQTCIITGAIYYCGGHRFLGMVISGMAGIAAFLYHKEKGEK
jgi:hypothetical protein